MRALCWRQRPTAVSAPCVRTGVDPTPVRVSLPRVHEQVRAPNLNLNPKPLSGLCELGSMSHESADPPAVHGPACLSCVGTGLHMLHSKAYCQQACQCRCKGSAAQEL